MIKNINYFSTSLILFMIISSCATNTSSIEISGLYFFGDNNEPISGLFAREFPFEVGAFYRKEGHSKHFYTAFGKTPIYNVDEAEILITSGYSQKDFTIRILCTNANLDKIRRIANTIGSWIVNERMNLNGIDWATRHKEDTSIEIWNLKTDVKNGLDKRKKIALDSNNRNDQLTAFRLISEANLNFLRPFYHRLVTVMDSHGIYLIPTVDE